MNKYYKNNETIFTHYYKVLNSDGISLHVNETSCSINLVYIITPPRSYVEVTEDDFNTVLSKTLNKLGINYGNFKFI
jgi:hypothetical protein